MSRDAGNIKKSAVDTAVEEALQSALEEKILDFEYRLETPLGEPTVEQLEDATVKNNDLVLSSGDGLVFTLPLAKRTDAGRIIPIKNFHASNYIKVRPGGDDTIDGGTDDLLIPPGHCYGYVVQNDAKWFEIWRPDYPKIKFTKEGGVAVLLTNGTGATTIKGTVVDLPSSDDTFEVCPANDIDAIGVVYDSGVAAGAEAWVVILGIAEALLEDSTAATAGYWCGISASQAGRMTANAISPANQTRHFQEMGHCLQTVTAGTDKLCRFVIHWN